MYGDCAKCTLNPTYYVPCDGPGRADIAVVGEAPGDVELRLRRPFVGPAGRLLNRIFEAVGVKRDEVFVTNAVCCRPVPHRAPKITEIAACRDRLYKELFSRRPKVVVALGVAAARALLSGIRSIKQTRGTVNSVTIDNTTVFVVPTYHPAAVLRNPSLYTDLLRDMQKAVRLASGDVVRHESPQYIVIDDEETMHALVERLKTVDRLAVDVETRSDGSLLCMALSWKPNTAVVLSEQVIQRHDTPALLRDSFRNKRLIAHNAKFDVQVLWSYGVTTASTGEDTLLMSYCLDERSVVEEEKRGVHGLKYLAREHLDAPDYSREVKPFIHKLEECPREALYAYNACDAAYTLLLADRFTEMLGEREKKLLRELLYPASDALARMEMVGVLVDAKHLTCLDYTYAENINHTIQTLQELAGVRFNPNSPKQVADVMYNVLKLPIPGSKKTDRETLELLASYHLFPAVMLSYRKLQKMHSVYVEGIADAVDRLGRVHTRFNLAATVTGRLSSSAPNLQNIAKNTEIRNIFVATPGYTLVEGDLSQAEVRVWCMLSRDERLRESIISGEDLHIRTACLMFGVRPENVTPEMRQAAKRLTFGTLYGMAAHSLAKELGISVPEAEDLQRRFFAAYPRGREWLEETKRRVLEAGMVETPFGRVRHFDLVTDTNRSAVLREAINTPIQSTASDITLSALVRLDRRIQRGEFGDTRLLLTVHDSILLETREEPETIARMLKEEMEKPVFDGWVPFEAEVKIGLRWGVLAEVCGKEG